MRSNRYTIGLVATIASAHFMSALGCSLEGLTFDLAGDEASGGGGSTSSSGTGAMSSSGTDGGGLPSSELCGNGVDDDGDGMTDCIDNDCSAAGFTCAQRAPNNWQGPVLFYDGPKDAMPSCPAQYPATAYSQSSGLSYSPASCNSCTCTGHSVTCEPPSIVAYSNAVCSNPTSYTFNWNTSELCWSASVNGGAGFKAPVPTVTLMGCQPQGGGIVSIDEPTWSSAGLVCGVDQLGTCSDSDSVCVPKPGDPFKSDLCIWRYGDFTCPSPYLDKHELGDPDEITDSRGCSPCNCPKASQFSCDLSYTLYSDADCTLDVFSFDADDTCNAPTSDVNVNSYEAEFDITGSCTASGGKPTGSVTRTNPVTVCCIP